MSDSDTPATLEALVDEYTASRLTVKSQHTVSLYKYTVRHFGDFLGHPGTLADFTEKSVTGFIRSREAKGLKAASVEREGNKILALWRFAALNGWCKPPQMRIAKTSPSLPTAWSRRELKQLFAATAAYQERIFDIPAAIYFNAMLRLFMDTGERIGAVCQLRWCDVDLEGRFVTFRKESRKGRGKARDNLQRLSRKTVRALREMQPYRETYVESLCERIRVWIWCPNGKNGTHIQLRYRHPITKKTHHFTTRTKDREEAKLLVAEYQADARRQFRHECIVRENSPRTSSEADALVFPGAHRERTSTWELYHHLKKILRAAGLPDDSRSMFHRLRRTHATWLHLLGGDATASLGHYNDQMTRDYYLDPRFTRTGYAADLLNGGIFQLLSRMFRRVKIALGLW